jgi:hypothetical protein
MSFPSRDVTQTGRRLARFNPASAWLVSEVPELRILDDVRQSPTEANHGKPHFGAMTHAFWNDTRTGHLNFARKISRFDRS